MKATFTAREPNILMEARPGDLFVPLGPDLVECVCAVESVEDRPDSEPRIADITRATELDPECRRPVIVLACRVGEGEPEFHPSGFKRYLRGATPISFLEQVEPAAFRERKFNETVEVYETHRGQRVRTTISIQRPCCVSPDDSLRLVTAGWDAAKFHIAAADDAAAARDVAHSVRHRDGGEVPISRL
jgi:hypothetical protein